MTKDLKTNPMKAIQEEFIEIKAQGLRVVWLKIAQGVDLKDLSGLAVVAQACNPSTLGGRGRRITWGQEFETSLADMVKTQFYFKHIHKLVGHGGACL